MAFNRPVSSTYTDDGGADYHQQKHALSTKAYKLISALRAQKLQPYINVSDTVFEFGVGMGWNLAQLRCAQKEGYDPSASLQQKVVESGVDFVSDLNQLQNQKFNVVLCHHTLEHVSDPAAVLAELAQFLVPNGTLLIFVPYEFQRKFRTFIPGEANHHLYSWTVQTLGALVDSVGFEVVEARVRPFGYERFISSFCSRWGLGVGFAKFFLFLIRLIKPAYEVQVTAKLNHS